MGELDRDAGEIHAKLLYYGPSGAGKTANVKFIERKLKREHRGLLEEQKVDGEDSGAYEILPVQLGEVRGFKTSIQVHTVPGADRFSDARRGLLDGADGVVFVADCRTDQHEATVASFQELTSHLESYGRSLEDIVLVVQYNHRDEADESALESLHNRLTEKPDASFDGIATEGTGVLQCLTTTSKAILSKLRKQADEVAVSPAAERTPPEETVAEAAPLATPGVVDATSAQTTFAVPPPLPEAAVELKTVETKDISLEPGGSVSCSGRELTIPLRLVLQESGKRIEFSIRVALDS